jgi:hypothetical protein
VSAPLSACMRGMGAQQKGKQPKGKGKAKAGSDGAGGGPSGKAAAAGSSGEASTSRGKASRPSAPPASIIGLSTEAPAVQDTLPVAEAASGAQQADPQPPPAGGGKKEKERQRKERQRQRKMDEAKEALEGAIEAMLDGARCVNPLWLMCLARCTQVIESRKCLYGQLAGCTHVSWECLWLQRGERAGRGGGGDGGGREAWGSQRAAGSAGGGGEDDARAC